jgi:hypothetical protein
LKHGVDQQDSYISNIGLHRCRLLISASVYKDMHWIEFHRFYFGMKIDYSNVQPVIYTVDIQCKIDIVQLQLYNIM